MRKYLINAIHFNGCAKEFEVQANNRKAAEKKFEKLFGAYWMLASIKEIK